MISSDLSVSPSLLAVVDHLIDDRIGIIRDVKEIPLQPGEPFFYHYVARPCDTRAFSGQRNFAEAGGASSLRAIALAKAIGEAIERYCAALYTRNDFPLASYDSAPFNCIVPEEFALYTPAQLRQPNFPYAAFTRSTPVRWTKTIDASTGEDWHVPASMVYAPYLYDLPNGEPAVAQPISTGLACHSSANKAAIAALCEVVERDAFTITWQAMLPAPHIHLDSLSEENRDLISRFEHAGGSVRILNITLDHGIPSFLAILMHDSQDLPTFSFAAATHLDPEVAVRKSLEELAHTRRLAGYLKYHPYPTARTQDVHVKLYTDSESKSAVEFLLRSEALMDFRSLPNSLTDNDSTNLETLCSKIRSVGVKPLLRDVTTPDIGGLGLSVYRAVIPGFHPLFMGHEYRALGGWRLWSVPQRLGYTGITKNNGDNPAPHPFP